MIPDWKFDDSPFSETIPAIQASASYLLSTNLWTYNKLLLKTHSLHAKFIPQFRGPRTQKPLTWGALVAIALCFTSDLQHINTLGKEASVAPRDKTWLCPNSYKTERKADPSPQHVISHRQHESELAFIRATPSSWLLWGSPDEQQTTLLSHGTVFICPVLVSGLQDRWEWSFRACQTGVNALVTESVWANRRRQVRDTIARPQWLGFGGMDSGSLSSYSANITLLENHDRMSTLPSPCWVCVELNSCMWLLKKKKN